MVGYGELDIAITHTYLDCRILRCFLQLRHHGEAEATGEADASQNTQRIVRERFAWRKGGSDDSIAQIVKALLLQYQYNSAWGLWNGSTLPVWSSTSLECTL